MMVQIMQPEDVAKVNFDPFDSTKIWPRSQFPMQEVGELILNRNPEVCPVNAQMVIILRTPS